MVYTILVQLALELTMFTYFREAFRSNLNMINLNMRFMMFVFVCIAILNTLGNSHNVTYAQTPKAITHSRQSVKAVQPSKSQVLLSTVNKLFEVYEAIVAQSSQPISVRLIRRRKVRNFKWTNQ